MPEPQNHHALFMEQWSEPVVSNGEFVYMDGGTLDLGLVIFEPWKWWHRFVPGRPRQVHYSASFSPDSDAEARAWWKSLPR
jgi:hypothetical protein